jgi:hypothetical protein
MLKHKAVKEEMNILGKAIEINPKDVGVWYEIPLISAMVTMVTKPFNKCTV